MAGQLNDRTGWFPDAYVELCEDGGVPTGASTASGFTADPIPVAAVTVQPAVSSVLASAAAAAPVEPVETGEYYVAAYPYESGEPDDLTFEAGESILVVKKDGDWWTGKIGFRVGIFPANYVVAPEEPGQAQAAEVVQEVTPVATAAYVAPVQATESESYYSVAAQEDSRAQQDVDSEVSEINTKPAVVDNVPQSASQTPVS